VENQRIVVEVSLGKKARLYLQKCRTNRAGGWLKQDHICLASTKSQVQTLVPPEK
jgi:hypothetical protein